MIKNLLSSLQEQTAGLDGSVSRDEFQVTPEAVVPLDADRRSDLVSYVLQHTSEAHTFKTAKGLKGIVYYDARGRGTTSVMDEMSDETVVFLAKQKGYEFVTDGAVVPDPVGAGYEHPQTESTLTEAKLLSRKKFYAALQDMVGQGFKLRGTLPSSPKKLADETYGKKSMMYISWVDNAERKRAEAELTKRGFKVNRSYHPGSGTTSVQVSYFKGWHWDEEVESQVGSILSEASGLDEKENLNVWKKTAERLLKHNKGKGQDDFYYRAYMRAVIQGNKAQATHIAKEFKGGMAARVAIIDQFGMSEDLDEGNGVTLKLKPGEDDYWFVMLGGKKVGGVSKDSKGGFDGSKRSGPKDKSHRSGFKNKEAAGAWVAGVKTEASGTIGDKWSVGPITWKLDGDKLELGSIKHIRAFDAIRDLARKKGHKVTARPGTKMISFTGLSAGGGSTLVKQIRKMLEWEELEEDEGGEMMAAHKRAAKAMSTVQGARRQFGDGWASSVTMGPGRRAIYLTVGISSDPKSGGQVIWLGVDLSGFGQERGWVAKDVERNEVKRAAAAFRRYSSDVTTISAENGVCRTHATVPSDKVAQAVKALPAMAKKFAQDVWKTRMSEVVESIDEDVWKKLHKEFPDWPLGDLKDAARSTSPRMSGDGAKVQKRYKALMNEEAEPLEEKIQVIHPYAHGMWVIRVEDALKAKLGKQFTWKKPILTSGSNRLIYRWSGRRSRGQLMPRTFRLQIDLDAGRDLFDVEIVLMDPQGEVVQKKTYRQVYIDQVVDPSFLTGWLRR